MISRFTNEILTNDNNLLSLTRNAVNCTNLSSAIYCSEKSVSKYIKAAVADNTRKGYKADLAHFLNWGGSIPSTPEIISQYLAAHAEQLAPATLGRRIVSISRAHASRGIDNPTKSDLVKATIKGIKRTLGTKQRQVSPVLKSDLINMVDGLKGIKGLRDKALLLIGFAAAFRRSELVSLELSDIEFVEKGLVINLRRSKTDQEAEGRKIAIPFARGSFCAVLALKNWLEVAAIDSGAIFRPVSRHGFIEKCALSSQAVALIVKERALAVGLNPSNFSGHSLRAGLVTSAAQAGVSVWKIRAQTGHKSEVMLNRYIRDANIFIDNAAGAIL